MWTQRWTFQAIMNAQFSVDSFFVLRYLINFSTLVSAIIEIRCWRPLSQFLIWNQRTNILGGEEATGGTTFGCIERVFLVHPLCNTSTELNILIIAIIKSNVNVTFHCSGTLVSYLLLKELRNKNGPLHINWALFYFHRFWRY